MAARTAVISAVVLATAVGAAGCGGKRQDADEPSGTYTVQVVDATFPTHQRLAQHTQLRITVRNTGQQAIPQLAVTVGDNSGHGFSQRSSDATLADPNKPVWIIDRGPRGGDTAYDGTWALGSVPAGSTRTFTWQVTPVVAGRHQVRYRIAAGLNGKAKAQLASGQTPAGTFDVDVDRAPGNARVDPDSGRIIRG